MIKLLKENVELSLCGFESSNGFLDKTSKAWALKEKKYHKKKKTGKLDFIKIKNFCASKNIIKKVKQQPTEWENIFANYITNKSSTQNI